LGNNPREGGFRLLEDWFKTSPQEFEATQGSEEEMISNGGVCENVYDKQLSLLLVAASGKFPANSNSMASLFHSQFTEVDV